MQNTSEDGSRMVGMEQCRISSIESNTSPLLDTAGEHVPVSTAVAARGMLYSQKSRGSHSSGGSSAGTTDDLCGGTEQEPLLPPSSRLRDENDDQKGSSASAHVNRLHFELFENNIKPEDERNEEEVQVENHGILTDSSTIQSGSNDTVCTSSSSAGSTSTTASATLTAASSQFAPPNKSSNNNSSPIMQTSENHHKTIKDSNTNNKFSKSSSNCNNNKNKRLRHLSTDTDDTSDISATLEPPDGGWGWVVVAASFLVNLIADGVTFSFGVFFMEFTHFFNEPESTTAWIGSLLAAMPLLSGPVASWLTDRYGCRIVTIVGGLLAALGFVLSSLTSSIYILMITFGVITGFGLSLCYVAAVVIVAYYFERRRSFATGLSVCGGGIGTFLFAPLSQYLIDSYGWQITTRILACAFLSLCACGILMKDLEWTKKKNKSSNNNNSNSHHTLSHNHHGCSGNNFSCHHHHHHFSSDKSDLSLLNCPKNNNRRCNSAICIPTFVREQERRERRQRYYSCNQDADNNVVGAVTGSGTTPGFTKPDPGVMDGTASPGGGSGKQQCTGKTCLITRQPFNNNNFSKDQFIDTNNLLLVGLSASPYHGGVVQDSCHAVDASIEVNMCPDIMAAVAAVAADLEEQLNPGGGELKIIPEEKDTKLCNPEIADIAQHDDHDGPEKIGNFEMDNRQELLLVPPDCISESSGLPPNNLRDPQINSSCFIINSDNNSCGIMNAVDPAIMPDSSDLIFTNHHIQRHTNQNFPTESNNFGINNNSSISSSNGVVRNNSFVRSNNLHNSVSSITTASTIMPTAAALPNGIPSIIIPPAQQPKQSVNSNNSAANNKLDLINTARYRSVMHRHSLTYRGAVLNLKRYRLRPASSCPDIISVATSTDGRGSFELMNVATDVCGWIRAVCEWENLMNVRFFLFILSNLLLYTWYDVPYMYLQTAAVRHGYSEDFSSYLISSIGLSNVVGNILLGYLGDKEWASATHVYGVCMIICGTTTVFMPYLMEWSYWGLFTICGVFGLTIAANYALTSVILVQVVSLERFASAYGLLLLVQGIGNLVGPPIAGVISDRTETNTWSFLVAGVGIFISSFFVLAPVFNRVPQPDAGGKHNNSPSSRQVQAQAGQVGHNDTV